MPPRRRVTTAPLAPSEDRETIDIDVVDSDPDADNPLRVAGRPIQGPLRPSTQRILTDLRLQGQLRAYRL